MDKKPVIHEICWHQLLRQFISIKNETVFNEDTSSSLHRFEQYKIVFQSSNNPLMTQRYVECIQSEISKSSVDFDNSMYNYFIRLIRLSCWLAREHKSNEYAYLSDYLILALQSIGVEKELNDICIDDDT